MSGVDGCQNLVFDTRVVPPPPSRACPSAAREPGLVSKVSSAWELVSLVIFFLPYFVRWAGSKGRLKFMCRGPALSGVI